MTRKKYVKLLMANGISRNYANVSASIARATGTTYEIAYKDFLDGLLYQIEKTIRRVSDMAYHMGCALAKAGEAFNKTFRVEMEEHEKNSRP